MTGSSAATIGLGEFETAVAAAAAADFQTATKRQKHKKRNSLSNSTAGSIKAKELLEQQSHMTHLFYNNASSLSVMMCQPSNPNQHLDSGHGSGGIPSVGSAGSGGGGVRMRAAFAGTTFTSAPPPTTTQPSSPSWMRAASPPLPVATFSSLVIKSHFLGYFLKLK